MINHGVDLQMQSRSALAADPAGLRDLGRAAQSGDAQGLDAVAREFEAMLIGQMLKQMRDASLGDGLFDNEQSKMYLEMQDQEIARVMSQGEGLGLREVLVRQLSQQGASPAELHDPERQAALGVPDRCGDLRTLESRAPGSMAPSEAVSPEAKEAASRDAAAPPSVPAPSAPVDWPPRDPAAFVQTLEPMARAAADHLGVDPDILLAQSALETGWGQHVPSRADGQPSFNLFGIKADSRWDGDRVSVGTLEYRDGIAQREQARFRAYADPAQSFSDYVEFIRNNPRYQRALQAGDAATYIRELQDAGYATDPAYADKVLRVRDQLAGYRDASGTQVAAQAAVTRHEG